MIILLPHLSFSSKASRDVFGEGGGIDHKFSAQNADRNFTCRVSPAPSPHNEGPKYEAKIVKICFTSPVADDRGISAYVAWVTCT